MARILIIDDDDAICRVLAKLLRLNGHEVQIARDGQAGVAAALAGPDLIICDLAMPLMDGHGVLATLKQDLRLADIPFIFLSGHADRESIRQSMNLGSDDFIPKPAAAHEILAAVTARLEQHQRRVQRQEAEVKKAVQIFSGIVDDLGSSAAAIHWLAQTAATGSVGEISRAIPPSGSPATVGPVASPAGSFLATRDNRRYFVKLSEVKALLADGEYSLAYWGQNQSMMFRKPLKQWEKELPAAQFVRIHRNAIVNLEFLEYVKKTPAGPQVFLRDFAQVLMVSQRKVPALNQALKLASANQKITAAN